MPQCARADRAYVPPAVPGRTIAVITCLLAAWPSSAAACATCGSGDPTLTVMGAGQPFAGRVRLSAELQYRHDAMGDATRVDEGQLQLGAAYAPADWVMISLTAPLVLRDVTFGDLAHATVAGLGQLDLRARFVLFRDRAFAPEHVFGLVAGASLPTIVDQLDPEGRLLPAEAQTGTGTFDPIGGVFYTWLADPLSLFASLTAQVPLAPRYAEAPGASVHLTVALQYRVTEWLTLRLGADARGDAPSSDDGRQTPGSEHVVVFAAPDVLVAPAPDVIFVLGARIPVAQHSPDGRSEGPYASLAMVVDL